MLSSIPYQNIVIPCDTGGTASLMALIVADRFPQKFLKKNVFHKHALVRRYAKLKVSLGEKQSLVTFLRSIHNFSINVYVNAQKPAGAGWEFAAILY